jgi:NAD-dependent deacetylase
VILPQELTERLGRVRSVGAITGAGISAESGIQTYRGKGGIYDDPEDGERTVEALSGHTLLSDPDRTWRAVGQLARQAIGARPNPAHHALVELEDRLDRFVLLTQNVDGLHQLAGNRNVIDIHGSIHEAVCLSCDRLVRFEPDELASIERTPRCERCQGKLRPNAVLFGELLPTEKIQRIYDEFHHRHPDLVLVAGTSAMFPYISQPVEIARDAGRLTIEVNPEPTLLSDRVDYSLRGKAGDYLPLIAGGVNDSWRLSRR